MFNKSLAANIIAASILLLGFISPWYDEMLKIIGLFALSGGITNWLAIHMLFNRIPLLYGSGVIPNRFDDFKRGIRNLILEEFFKIEDITRFGKISSSKATDAFVETLDMDKVYEALVDTIVKSSLGPSINLFGGTKLLETLRNPVKNKIKEIILEIGKKEGEKIGLKTAQNLREEVVKIVDGRMKDLTPENIKEIVEDIIRKHLGWLVVWGAVFGGLIGGIVGITSLIN